MECKFIFQKYRLQIIYEVRMPAADSKGALKNPRELKDNTSSSHEDKLVVTRALSSPPLKNYSVWWSLSDSKYAGTALFIKKCFQPKKVSFSLDAKGSKHEPDGRVILAEFETFRILNTYVPNNGWKEEESSFPRRRKWDKRMLEFVLATSDKPLIWCGDLNVRIVVNLDLPWLKGGGSVNIGKPVDAYRFLHKDSDMECGFSWSGNPVGKYRGKRMRIDYFIVSEKLKDRIVSCEMHGRGIELDGFYGSDHCPVSL
ncbi:hypothetical protein K7X08_024652 [Anisodus acutangulus]|uniref:Endonuclease/exonuclease/phosphatase domain-containing protein n=1 Tax=Anisodus acutangulus TaxID=402998 RepID=A0A9Q1RFW8_9SOLA|nr:hypothetical protein K7X08_024652 [Anisodus acutangulus]